MKIKKKIEYCTCKSTETSDYCSVCGLPLSPKDNKLVLKSLEIEERREENGP